MIMNVWFWDLSLVLVIIDKYWQGRKRAHSSLIIIMESHHLDIIWFNLKHPRIMEAGQNCSAAAELSIVQLAILSLQRHCPLVLLNIAFISHYQSYPKIVHATWHCWICEQHPKEPVGLASLDMIVIVNRYYRPLSIVVIFPVIRNSCFCNH